MDGFNPLQIPFYQDDTFLFQDSIFPDHITIFQDLHHHASSDSLITSNNNNTPFLPSAETGTDQHPVLTAGASAAAAGGKKEKRGRKPSMVEDGGTDRNEKRAVHRDIERQRRQEMAHLYASLRNLLPLEYIKGKRAITDHIHQSISYIKHKEATIRELEVKRNKLKSQVGETSEATAVENGQPAAAARRISSNITFTVGSCLDGGIEILMGSDLADENWFPLSRVLSVLLKQGLSVVNCNYTKLNQKLLCTIRTDAGGPQMNDEDLRLLREKLDAKVSEWKI